MTGATTAGRTSSVERSDMLRLFAGRSVWVTYLLLVAPTVAAALDARLATPLALPGYLALSIGSSIGSRLFPNFQMWVYLGPFFVGAYGVSVVVAAGYRGVRASLADGE